MSVSFELEYLTGYRINVYQPLEPRLNTLIIRSWHQGTGCRTRALAHGCPECGVNTKQTVAYLSYVIQLLLLQTGST
jgi:hypothetical protein